MVRFARAALLVLAACFLSSAAAQQPAAVPYEPSVGQPGKDVVWVPTPEELVRKMLEMARVKPGEFVMDLGSGDGRIAIAAARDFGARAVGIEYNPDMVALSQRNAKAAGVADKVRFVKADLFETDLGKADVITMYLLPRINMQLRPKLLALKPGTRIVSHAFDLGDWKSDDSAVIEGREAFLWIVPAKIGGEWQLAFPEDPAREPFTLALTQNYQLFWGSARRGGESTELIKPWLSGADVRFHIPQAGDAGPQYTGRVEGNRIEGTVRDANGKPVRWTARRVKAPAR